MSTSGLGSLPARLACLVVLIGAGLAPPFAIAQTYRIDPDRSTAGFVVSHFGFIPERGQFNRASGTIVVDPSGIAGGSIEVVIDLASVDTGWELRDAFLRGASMFDVARFPILRFRSTHLEYRNHQIVAAEGNVTLHGVTRPLRLGVARLACNRNPADGREGCGAAVTGRLSRRDFGMVYAYPLVGDDVDLDFAITALRIRDEGGSEAP